MKTWENVVCSHDDGFHADCFACGFKFCKQQITSEVEAERKNGCIAGHCEHSRIGICADCYLEDAKVHKKLREAAVEAREREISEKIMKYNGEGCYALGEILAIINPPKE